MSYAFVNTAIAPLMAKPAAQCERTDEALYGMRVELLEQVSENWYWVRTPYNYVGYTPACCLLPEEDCDTFWQNAPKKVVLHSYIDIQARPEVEAYCICSVTRGALFVPVGEPDEKGWLLVALCNGQRGYVKARFLGDYITSWSGKTEQEEIALRKALVQSALAYMGTQYRWGGKTTLGIDCSGLCSMAYLLNGVVIYRDAHIKEGFPMHPITLEQIKEGDLLFFPGHVAMYIGNGRYIHSTAKKGSDGVVINSLNPQDEDYREDLPAKMNAVGSIF